MAAPICEDFIYEPALDGRLVINRTLEGPPLATVSDDFDLGGLMLAGAQAVPYVKFGFLTTWAPKEALIGPARSILGLAPGEELTIDVTIAYQFDYAAAVTNTAEYSQTVDTTQRDYTETGDVTSKATETTTTDSDSVDLGPLGSWGKSGDTGTATISEIIEHTSTSIAEMLKSVSTTQTNGKSVEVSMSAGMQRENTVTRRVVNPYRDRSLELRFHPVFRRFEVTTLVLEAFEVGLSVIVGAAKFAPRVALMHADFLDRTVRDRAALGAYQAQILESQEPETSSGARILQAHLDANAPHYTAAFLAETVRMGGRSAAKGCAQQMLERMPGLARSRSRNVNSALAFDRMRVKSGRIMLPARSLEHFKDTLKLPRWESGIVDDLVAAGKATALPKVSASKQDVRMFMGTHVEAVAGSCVLQDLPAATA
jgi:hypothetical protein